MKNIFIAVVEGTLIEKSHMEKYVEDFMLEANAVDIDSPILSQKDRLLYAKEQVESISRFYNVGRILQCIIWN